MQNDLKYQVRSREIGDLVSALRSGRLTMSPYFQRNLVWRESHKHDFIKTILEGYPFPQIFLARGAIDLQSMQSFTCVVDGQQRLNAIREFVSDGFAVEGRKFSDLTNDEKTSFIKYEVPIIDFDLDVGDPRLKDVFKRLNRTFYSLSAIERIATEYSASEFLLIARLLCGDIAPVDDSDEEVEVAIDVLGDNALVNSDDPSKVDANDFLRDPGITAAKWAWLQERAGGRFAAILSDEEIFSPYEFQRKVPLMFVLNVMCTVLGGYYGRNSRVKEYLENFGAEFPSEEEIIQRLSKVAANIEGLGLDDDSIWWNKANFFTMVCELAFASDKDLDIVSTGRNLSDYEKAPSREFLLAAREAVNNKPERALRGEVFRSLIVLH